MDVSNRSGPIGSAVAILAVAWLLASGAVVAMNGREALRVSESDRVSPIPWQPVELEPTPVELPAALLFASRIDPLTGGTVERRTTFEPGQPVAFTAWLGVPAEVDELTLEVRRLSLDGSDDVVVGEPRRLETDPQLPFVFGELPAATLAGQEPGSFRLDLYRGDEWIALGAFQLGGAAPERIELFAHPRLVHFSVATHTGVRFDDAGEVVDELTATITDPARAQAEAVAVAVFGGEEHVLIGSGTWAGYWIRASERVRLAPRADESSDAGAA